MRLRDGLYQTDLPIPRLHQTISLVNLTDGIAYELNVSKGNIEQELFKNISKILTFNQINWHV